MNCLCFCFSLKIFISFHSWRTALLGMVFFVSGLFVRLFFLTAVYICHPILSWPVRSLVTGLLITLLELLLMWFAYFHVFILLSRFSLCFSVLTVWVYLRVALFGLNVIGDVCPSWVWIFIYFPQCGNVVSVSLSMCSLCFFLVFLHSCNSKICFWWCPLNPVIFLHFCFFSFVYF